MTWDSVARCGSVVKADAQCAPLRSVEEDARGRVAGVRWRVARARCGGVVKVDAQCAPLRSVEEDARWRVAGARGRVAGAW